MVIVALLRDASAQRARGFTADLVVPDGGANCDLAIEYSPAAPLFFDKLVLE